MPSLSVKFDNVVFPLDHEIDIRGPQEWLTPNFTQATVHAIFVAAIYDGVARAARDGLIEFLKSRVPSNLGASLVTLPRAQEIVGGIGARLAVNAPPDRQFCRRFRRWRCAQRLRIQHRQAHCHQ